MRLSGLCAILLGCPHEGSHTHDDVTVRGEGTDVEDGEQEDVEGLRNQLRVQLDKLQGFASSLHDIDQADPMDFCEKACEAWQSVASVEPPPPLTPAMLVILGALEAFANLMTAVMEDYYNTPDVRDRITRGAAQQALEAALNTVRRDGERWLAEGLPLAEEIKRLNNAALCGVQAAKEMADKRQAEEEAHEAEMAADPYGAILIHLDPTRSDAPIFEKVCSLTEDQDKRYRGAYERLRRMIDSELLEHIDDESKRFCDQLIAVLIDLRDNRISLLDVDAWDEHRRKVRSALISFTAALQIHQEQTINAAKKTFGRNTPQLAAVEKLFKDLRKSSFDYGWLEEMRDALQHGDINAFRWGFGASMHGDPTANVYMNREFMLQFTSRAGNKPWLKRRELEERDSDPSVLDMIKAVQPLMGPLQEKLDKILYPDVADDVATVRELLSRYPTPMGLHALQNGPGFTRRNLSPPISPMAARVLQFVATYEPEGDSDEDSAPERPRLFL